MRRVRSRLAGARREGGKQAAEMSRLFRAYRFEILAEIRQSYRAERASEAADVPCNAQNAMAHGLLSIECTHPRREMDMSIGTILLIVLILILVGALPTWPYSSAWGYGPSGIAGVVVLALIVLLIMKVI